MYNPRANKLASNSRSNRAAHDRETARVNGRRRESKIAQRDIFRS